MSEGTAASMWASSAPATKDKQPAPKEPIANNHNSNQKGGRGGSNSNKKRGRGGRRQSTATTTTDAPPTSMTADATPRLKLIDRLSIAPDSPASLAAQASAGGAAKADSPDSKSQPNRRGNGNRNRERAGSKRKAPPAKVNTAAAQKDLEKENAKEEAPHPDPDPEPEAEPEQAKDAPPHIQDSGDNNGALTPNVNGLADRFKTLNTSAPGTPRPYTPSAIDWAGETEDGSLPDLDDWGVSAKASSPTEDSKPEDKHVDKPAPPVQASKPNGRDNKRKDSKAGKNLTVPNRSGANHNGNASSRPVTPSSTGFSPSLRGKHLPARASSRASALNDPPPQITVSAQDKPATTGLGLDLAVDEPVFASINDPLPEPSSELHTHIKPIRTPNAHPHGRGARGRGGKPRMSDGNAQPQPGASPAFGMPMHMSMPSSPHMPPSPHLPSSPYLPGAQFPPSGYHPGYSPGPYAGYPQPHSPGFINPGPAYGHQHSYSHPQHSPRPHQHHHSPRNPHHHPNESPRHQRAHSRPVIAGSALNMLTKTLQSSSSPPKPKADVSASS
ncbi:unnamed protein product [Rhizoctonia solani]|uniref:Uncharacterized protein n=1 Tax=Rhizoctonia solani TaxID=456999 RepID=A0A8H2X3F1_9AGAM|nr:unnamed protein product [Rhizoctonia solani]